MRKLNFLFSNCNGFRSNENFWNKFTWTRVARLSQEGNFILFFIPNIKLLECFKLGAKLKSLLLSFKSFTLLVKSCAQLSLFTICQCQQQLRRPRRPSDRCLIMASVCHKTFSVWNKFSFFRAHDNQLFTITVGSCFNINLRWNFHWGMLNVNEQYHEHARGKISTSVSIRKKGIKIMFFHKFNWEQFLNNVSFELGSAIPMQIEMLSRDNWKIATASSRSRRW